MNRSSRNRNRNRSRGNRARSRGRDQNQNRSRGSRGQNQNRSRGSRGQNQNRSRGQNQNRSRSRRRSNFKKYSVVIPNPERRNSNLYLQIPSPSRCLSSPRRNNRPLSYCGTKPNIPRGYSRRGTNYECLRKGFGAGICSIYKQ